MLCTHARIRVTQQRLWVKSNLRYGLKKKKKKTFSKRGGCNRMAIITHSLPNVRPQRTPTLTYPISVQVPMDTIPTINSRHNIIHNTLLSTRTDRFCSVCDRSPADRHVVRGRVVPVAAVGGRLCQRIGVHAVAVEESRGWLPTDVGRTGQSRAQRHGGQRVPVGRSSCRQLHRHRRHAVHLDPYVLRTLLRSGL